MKRRITFNPQAWVNNHAVKVDAEGDTTFYADATHLQQFPSDQLKYELEPYQGLPQLPQWIRNWNGPFYFEEASQ